MYPFADDQACVFTSQPFTGARESGTIAPVDAQQLLDELVQAAARLGVEVRTEPFETPAAMGGGLCIVRGAHLVLIDQRAPLVDRLRALARALGDLGSEAVYMAPEARELVDRRELGSALSTDDRRDR